LSYTSRYDNGDWIADCDVCGRKYKASALSQRWDGLMCCDDDWEIRQPQDFVRGVPDTQIAPWLRPEPPNYFLPVTQSQLELTQSISNVTISTLFKPGSQLLSVNEIVIATIDAAIRYPVTGGARQLNGSPLNTNSLG
jgi:hypothetical protein